jgi:hypothetical protein
MASSRALASFAFLAAVPLALAAACTSTVVSDAKQAATTTSTTTTTTGGGGSSGACGAPRSDRSEAGQCSPGYGVDESNPMCCRRCGAGEVAVDDEMGPRCVGADAGAGGGGGGGGTGGAGGGFACPKFGQTYGAAAKACVATDDCTMVAIGCYCGSQPVVGVAKASAAAAKACEAAAAQSCALGCAVMDDTVAEDGKSPGDGGTIVARCDEGACHSVVE